MSRLPLRSAAGMTALMCVAETLSMTGFACYTTLLPVLMKDWTLSNTEAGLIGGIFYTGYMVSVPVLASLTDRIDSRKIYAFACLLSALGAAGFALFADGLASALLFQFVIGAGLGGTYMPGLKTLTDHLEGRAQSRATAFYTAAFGVGSSISIFLSGLIAASYGWPAAFAFGATGPAIAAVLVFCAMPGGRVRAAHAASPALLDFRPVLKNHTTRLYVFGYSVHNYELFGQRSWMVAFLVFCGSLQTDGAGLPLAAATFAALVNALGPVMSVSGNELALRFGRERMIFTFMGASGALACVLGFTASWPWAFVVLLMCIHYGCMLGDSAALTAGVIATAPPEQRGATMAVYSLAGFTAAFLAPLVFGVVLDLAGGNQNTMAWGLAFASIGIFGALAPFARWLAAGRARG